MDHQIFTALIQNLHPVSVLSLLPDQTPPPEFSEKYCYHPSLQACFSAERLADTVSDLSEHVILEVQDAVGIRILLCRLDGRVYLLGPFVTQVFQENRIRPALVAHRLSASYIPSLKLYYSAFPLVSDQDLVHTVLALIRVLCPEEPEYVFRHAAVPEEGNDGKNGVASRYQARFDYRSIQKRYEIENAFLQRIEEGDTARVLEAFDRMGIAELNNRRYMNAIYSVPEVSHAMIRALSRKAAERGGAPLPEINEITQHAVQAAKGLSSERQLLRNIHTMILELTEAVRRHRESDGGYSAPIQRAVSFLRSNYSQSVSLEETAKAAGFAPTYLSRRFREETGLTVCEDVRKLRCRQASKLLKETNLPVGEIAFYVGYPDSNYFSKAFKTEYGMPPLEWRKRGGAS